MLVLEGFVVVSKWPWTSLRHPDQYLPKALTLKNRTWRGDALVTTDSFWIRIPIQ
jgi:hypothetical protein